MWSRCLGSALCASICVLLSRGKDWPLRGGGSHPLGSFCTCIKENDRDLVTTLFSHPDFYLYMCQHGHMNSASRKLLLISSMCCFVSQFIFHAVRHTAYIYDTASPGTFIGIGTEKVISVHPYVQTPFLLHILFNKTVIIQLECRLGWVGVTNGSSVDRWSQTADLTGNIRAGWWKRSVGSLKEVL